MVVLGMKAGSASENDPEPLYGVAASCRIEKPATEGGSEWLNFYGKRFR